MTILEALKSLTPYPVPTNTLEKLCVDRGLDSGATYDVTVSTSDGFRLASADLYMYMYGAPSLGEQEVSITVVERKNFRVMANKIYGDLDDPKYTGRKLGYKGTQFND